MMAIFFLSHNVNIANASIEQSDFYTTIGLSVHKGINLG